ncbi:ATP-binding cassette domain-containing protein [Pontiella sulfatireligans]|uniref:Leukotoxin export ATP-binding protein LtxB n=1 Tax=Pontiella sulfatireligans TaxID=2750658 RepID=A0A6C2UM08_9BACT|nr:ABC transporter ATP-binding protein [Pontiella sulfatireligans]VGO21295.1 Leukotoxin export ATP-binding protein LtxB [Pontiella sulfatireligans]
MHLLEKFRIVYDLLDAVDKRKLALIFAISVLNGLINAAGIASILPFIGLISEPEILDTNKYILMFTQATGIESYAGVVVSFGLIAMGMLIVGNTISVFESWYGVLFGATKNQEFSSRLLRNYLRIDVLEFEKKKSGERAKEVLSDVGRVVISTLFSMLDLISDIIGSVFVVGLLLWIDWKVTLAVFSTLIFIHYLINHITSSKLDFLGKRYAKLEASLYSHVLEALKLNKEVKMNSIAPYFVRRFSDTSGQMVKVSVKSALVSQLPQQILEVVAFGAILSVALYFAVFASEGGQPVTIIGMYAVAAYRLIPTVASIFSRIKSIWYDTAILEDVAKSLVMIDESEEDAHAAQWPAGTIALCGVSFAYSKNAPFHLDGLNLDFPVNRFTCIKGKTGCGKSTVMNLVAGLYHPAKGTLACDGQPINAFESKSWKRQIGLVPANVNIIQASLYENIALGIEAEDIDREKVHAVCRLVDLDELLCGLPNGYESVYGEDGLCFSSGQVLKVGLARAMYREPRMLLLDESTDAFDLKTETLILNRLKATDDLTIIFISHRPSVMEHADLTIDLEMILGTSP